MAIGNESRSGLSARVGSEIKAELVRRGVTQKELARAIGQTDQWVSLRAKGAVPLTLDDLSRIADALGMEPEALMKAARSSPPRARLRTVNKVWYSSIPVQRCSGSRPADRKPEPAATDSPETPTPPASATRSQPRTRRLHRQTR